MRTIGIHQPNYLAWLGYFDKISKCDLFVILDNVQYEKNCYTNRTQIKTPRGKEWLTFAIKRDFPQLIKDVKFANFNKDRDNHLKAIELNYKKAKSFNLVFPIIKQLLSSDWEYLSEFNTYLIKMLVRELHIKTDIVIASDYDFEGHSTELLINICKYFGADKYLSGNGAKDYQEEEMFKKEGIKLEYNNFKHPIYEQRWGEFISGLSVIDKMLNENYGN